MPIEDQPDEIIAQIFENLPIWLLHDLLKSKTYSHVAYHVFYKAVIIDEHYSDSFSTNVAQEFRELQNLSYGFPDAKGYETIPAFANSKHLVAFAESHPLFVPHTLLYKQISDLNTLEEIKPGFLQQFKTLHKMPGNSVNAKPTFDLASLNHSHFTSYPNVGTTDADSSIETDDIPDAVMHLILGESPVKKVMKSVTSLSLSSTLAQSQRYTWLSMTTQTEHNHPLSPCNTNFSFFPNLKTLHANCQGSDVHLDIPHLKRIVLEDCGNVDLRPLKSLETVFLEVGGSVGFTDRSRIILSKNIKTLTLYGSMEDEQLRNLYQLESLKALSLIVKHPYQVSIFTVPCPPELEHFKFQTVEPYFNPVDYGENRYFHENCTVRVSLRFRSLPNTLKTLNVKGAMVSGLELPSLINLTKLIFKNCIIDQQNFPVGLNHIEIDGAQFREPLKQLNSLECLYHDYLEKRTINEALIPQSVKQHFWGSLRSRTIEGGENLQFLTLHNCSVDYNFRNFSQLRRLHIQSHVIHSPVFPEHLQSLKLEQVVIKGDFLCPPNLEHLALISCRLEYEAQLINKTLKALVIHGCRANINGLFWNVGPRLESLDISSSFIRALKFDLSSTGLSFFRVRKCPFDASKSKVIFPKSLRIFKMESCYDDNGRRQSLEWADLTLCSDKLIVMLNK